MWKGSKSDSKIRPASIVWIDGVYPDRLQHVLKSHAEGRSATVMATSLRNLPILNHFQLEVTNKKYSHTPVWDILLTQSEAALPWRTSPVTFMLQVLPRRGKARERRAGYAQDIIAQQIWGLTNLRRVGAPLPVSAAGLLRLSDSFSFYWKRKYFWLSWLQTNKRFFSTQRKRKSQSCFSASTYY